MFTRHNVKSFNDDTNVFENRFPIDEHGADPDDGTILSPVSTGTSADTETSVSSPETSRLYHEDAADSHDQTIIPLTTSLAELSEPSKPKRFRRGGFCPLECGTHLSRIDHYRLQNHYISCRNYTGDRQALKARYRKKKKSKQTNEKSKSDGAQAEATRHKMNRQALCNDCSQPFSHHDIQVTVGSEHQHTLLAQHRWDLLGAMQVPPSIDAVTDRRPLECNSPTYLQEFTNEVQRMTDLYPAMGLSSQPTLDFHYQTVPCYDSINATHPANVSVVQHCSHPHPSIQVAMHPVPTQHQRALFSDAVQVSIPAEAVADRYFSENSLAYTQEFNYEVKTTTAEVSTFAATELSSQPSLGFHYPTPHKGNVNAMHPTYDGYASIIS